MIVGSSTVNNAGDVATQAKKAGSQKKAGLERARLEVLAT